MKIYISVPETSFSPKARENMDNIRRLLSKAGYEVINPFDNYFGKKPDETELLLSRIKLMLKCDTIYLCKDWSSSKICQSEKAIAEIYGKRVKYEIVEMPIKYWSQL